MVKTILVPLDGSRLAEYALPQARRLAHATHATLILVRVVHGGAIVPANQRAAVEEAERYLRHLEERLTARGYSIRTDVFLAEPVEGIVLASQVHAADVIVMCTHGLTGLRQALLGSVAHKTLREVGVPVLMVQASATKQDDLPHVQATPYQHILVPLDGSQRTERALRYITEQDFARDAEFVLMHSETPAALRIAAAYGPIMGVGGYVPQATLNEADQETRQHCASANAYLTRMAQTYLPGRPWRSCVPLDDAAHATVHQASAGAIDLIVMTTHARAGLDRLLSGTIAGQVLHHAHTPVLLLREPEEPVEVSQIAATTVGATR